MAIIKYERSAATVSWIDPATGLPEVDEVKPTGMTATRMFLTGDAGFRFCNFIDVWANYDTVAKRITGQGFTPASKLYKAPSFAKIPSHVFPQKQDVKLGSEPITFTQIVGARTESPEVIGGTVGGLVGGPILGPVGRYVGEKVAHAVSAFPPIWSQLRLKIFNDGRFQVELLQYSLFPSLTFYKARLDAGGKQTINYDRANVTLKDGFYDAVPNLEKWKTDGWGPIRSSSGGPTGGNPWELKK